MRIGELANRTGSTERALRYYEEKGLLAPVRRPSGYREYAECDVQAVSRIRTLLAAGLTTDTIAQTLPCLISDGGQLRAVCPELCDELRQESVRIDTAIGRLRSARQLIGTIMANSWAGQDG